RGEQGDERARALAGRERAGRPRHGVAAEGEAAEQVPRLARREAGLAQERLEQRLVAREEPAGLVEPRDPRSRADAPRSRRERQLARQRAEQRRLAGAV